MHLILPGLFLGNLWDSKDKDRLAVNKITHIVSVHDSAARVLLDKYYLCIQASDIPGQNLEQYFSICNDFIHKARLNGGNVLVHCLAGVSRSVTLTVAYVMSVTKLNWSDALKVVRALREVANPNLGFQRQLREFDLNGVTKERQRLLTLFHNTKLQETDELRCKKALEKFNRRPQNQFHHYGNDCYIDLDEGDAAEGAGGPNDAPAISQRREGPNSVSYNISMISRIWKSLPSNHAEPDTDRAKAPKKEGNDAAKHVSYFDPVFKISDDGSLHAL